jgi:hypothetical protein
MPASPTTQPGSPPSTTVPGELAHTGEPAHRTGFELIVALLLLAVGLLFVMMGGRRSTR